MDTHDKTETKPRQTSTKPRQTHTSETKPRQRRDKAHTRSGQQEQEQQKYAPSPVFTQGAQAASRHTGLALAHTHTHTSLQSISRLGTPPPNSGHSLRDFICMNTMLMRLDIALYHAFDSLVHAGTLYQGLYQVYATRAPLGPLWGPEKQPEPRSRLETSQEQCQS